MYQVLRYKMLCRRTWKEFNLSCMHCEFHMVAFIWSTSIQQSGFTSRQCSRCISVKLTKAGRKPKLMLSWRCQGDDPVFFQSRDAGENVSGRDCFRKDTKSNVTSLHCLITTILRSLCVMFPWKEVQKQVTISLYDCTAPQKWLLIHLDLGQ